ncbi:MAG: V-type ATPase subunit [Candidatus Ratteibacteria bacterium]|nr:V-type ATPase subunit [Candidatus Ratteibacteria bacterium]
MDTIGISGRIKALEKTFLTAEDITRIVNAKSFSEATGILNGTIYQIPQNISSSRDINNFFNNTILNLIKEMEKCLPEELYYYFLLPYDFYNLKLIFENYKTGKESKNYIPHTSVDYFTVREAFEKDNFKEIPPHLKELIGFVSKNREAEDILMMAKKVYWDIVKDIIATQHSDFISGYIKTEIDLSNLGIFLNCQIAKIPCDVEFLADGGRIQRERYSREDVLWSAVDIMYRGLKTPVTIDGYDTAVYIIKMGYLKDARVISLGIEPIFSYFAARQMEIDNIRRLLIGKFYNVDVSRIGEWVLPAYQYV